MIYDVHCGSSDPLGMNLIENIVAVAAIGGKVKEGTIPYMRFPHLVVMTVEADEPPVPHASMRVFESNTRKEIYAVFIESKASEFSTDQEVDISLATNDDGEPWTKEQLDGMDFESEFRQVCRAVGITGRSRDKMTKEYLAKVVK